MTQPKLKQDIKARWVAALRSGNYQQGHRALRTGSNHFCCLGVLCDLAAKDGVAECEWQQGSEYSMWGATGVLPNVVVQWAFDESCAPEMLEADRMWFMRDPMLSVPGGTDMTLASMNDGCGSRQPASFDYIANLIEEQL